jgi:tRNA(fMet)-specific endonuclease VapC
MAYLLDTDTISATMRPRPDLHLARRIANVPDDALFFASITLGELLFGAMRRRNQRLLDEIFEFAEFVPVLSFDDDAARVYALLKTELERQGTPLAEPDLRIAATALVWDLTLVTGNVRHFARVPGLTVENWLSPAE